MPLRIGRGSGVAVVEMHGVIGSQVRASAYSRIFEGVARSKSYKALLLDIDSPGGSAAASEPCTGASSAWPRSSPSMPMSGGWELPAVTPLLRASRGSPCKGHGRLHRRDLLAAVLSSCWDGPGRVLRLQRRKVQGHDGFWRSPTAEESEKLQELIDEIYDNFVADCIQGRSLPEESVRELATGEVMTAQRAIGAGLVDQIGDFTDALNAAAVAGLTRPRARILQPRRTLSQSYLPDIRPVGVPGWAVGRAAEDLNGGIYYLDPPTSPLAGEG